MKKNYGKRTDHPVRQIADGIYNISDFGVLTPGVTFRDVQCGPYRTKLIPLSDEGSFDLGERTVRYKHMPGHTNGSIVLWDDKTKTFFAGDNMCACPWLFLANAAPVEVWLQTAKFILKQADDYTVYWSHEGGLLKKELMERVVELGEEVVAKYGRGFQFLRIKFYPCNDRVNGSIAFRTRNVKM